MTVPEIPREHFTGWIFEMRGWSFFREIFVSGPLNKQKRLKKKKLPENAKIFQSSKGMYFLPHPRTIF